MLFFVDTPLVTSCSIAVHYYRYQWTRDGAEVTLPTADDSGTVIIQNPTVSDAGLYQCFARNDVGKAMSNTTQVVKSDRARFPDNPVQAISATIGDPLRLHCQPDMQSVPSPSFADFSWQDNNRRSWQLGQRVQIDDNGRYTEAKASTAAPWPFQPQGAALPENNEASAELTTTNSRTFTSSSARLSSHSR